ncbi:MAG: tRNA pseudouridine(38-40) synthase TruA [Desulfobulbaceae bacterium]|nr:tRNA pseudouridine(38-40) synthase TruA [Desulfobulbaceae bacterium]
MRTLLLLIAYDGTEFAGWQRQKGQPTIQGEIEARLSRMTNAAVILHGAGRTDAGVHALGMTASFETTSTIPCAGFFKGLNSLLPPAIRVLAVEEKESGFHARFSARGKCYLYHLTCGGVDLPTRRLYTCHVKADMAVAPMQQCLRFLLGTHDFSAFEGVGSRDPAYQGGRGAVRTISRAELLLGQGEASDLTIELAGDGFLRHMVRNIVGTLLEVGRERMRVEDFAAVLAGRDRMAAGATAPARGLFLKEVFY